MSVESVEESSTSMSHALCFLLEFLSINSPSIDCLLTEPSGFSVDSSTSLRVAWSLSPGIASTSAADLRWGWVAAATTGLESAWAISLAESEISLEISAAPSIAESRALLTEPIASSPTTSSATSTTSSVTSSTASSRAESESCKDPVYSGSMSGSGSGGSSKPRGRGGASNPGGGGGGSSGCDSGMEEISLSSSSIRPGGGGGGVSV